MECKNNFGNITLSIIKPDAVINGYIIPIIIRILDKNFVILAIKIIKLSRKEVKIFYWEHRNEKYFNKLVNFMSSESIVIMILKKTNAVQDFRQLIGHTDPKNAKKNTIRNLYAMSIERNSIHGSDNNNNAIKECKFFFDY